MSARIVREAIGTETYQISAHEQGLTEAEFMASLTPSERAHVLPLAGMNQSHVGHFPHDDGLFALIKLPLREES